MDKNEKMFDTFLGIKTIEGISNAQFNNDIDSQNNIYQATYYRDLVTLFDEVSLEPEDTLVDFGCGLGRVLFYCNQRHYCKTTGIEQDSSLYENLLTNARSYQSKFLEQEERMSFLNISADTYDIVEEDNYFYFFNPFSAEIFQKVIDNIIESVKSNPRDINVIIYYPTFEYQRIIRDSKLFVLKKIIKLSGYEEDPDEKVLVYHLSKYFV
jgi:SAM-dependent methyltransferase